MEDCEQMALEAHRLKLVCVHGILEATPTASALQADWNSRLFPPPMPLPDETFAFWGDLSTEHSAMLTRSDQFWCDMMEIITDNHFLGDIWNYYYDAPLRQDIQQRLIAVLDDSPTVLLTHSLGTLIAYDVLVGGSYNIPTFITIGSPLGLAPVLAEQHRVYNNTAWCRAVA